MSLRSTEEALTALSYPHVAYRLEGGYGKIDPVSMVAGAVTASANAVAAWKTSEEATKQAAINQDTAEVQAGIAKQNAAAVQAQASAQKAIEELRLKGMAISAGSLPVKITAALVFTVVLGSLALKLRRG